MQRESECLRRGHSDEEFRVRDACQFWSSNALANMCVCFECGYEFQLYDPDRYPEICANPQCRRKYRPGDVGMHCLPDVVLHNNGSKAIVYVNGPKHDEPKQKAKDRYQQFRLREYGYKIFVIKCEEVGRIRNSNLYAMAKTWIEATSDPVLFEKLMRNEKE